MKLTPISVSSSLLVLGVSVLLSVVLQPKIVHGQVVKNDYSGEDALCDGVPCRNLDITSTKTPDDGPVDPVGTAGDSSSNLEGAGTAGTGTGTGSSDPVEYSDADMVFIEPESRTFAPDYFNWNA